MFKHYPGKQYIFHLSSLWLNENYYFIVIQVESAW
jgi:hypothetical protein